MTPAKGDIGIDAADEKSAPERDRYDDKLEQGSFNGNVLRVDRAAFAD